MQYRARDVFLHVHREKQRKFTYVCLNFLKSRMDFLKSSSTFVTGGKGSGKASGLGYKHPT